ncbi:hypothetical protein ZWY2020_045935 [Hordeum vulgare]|nr:hypothetical protein ZWY2020_045935 [Hordeum vulgare]
MTQAIVERACAKLRSAIGDEAVARWNFTADLQKMLEALEAIQPMLDRVEMQTFSDMWVAQRLSEAESEAFMDSRGGVWLQRALNAAYKTIDTVDELQDARPKAAATMTRMLPRLAIMRNAMTIEVQETKKLVMSAHEQLSGLLHHFTGKPVLHGIADAKRITGPVFEEAMVLGRGSDKQRTIAALLSSEPNITQEHNTILPIFGFPGSGKTTLAQMVFNDTHSLQGYDFRVWIHVSPQFEFHTIAESIINHVSGRGQKANNWSSYVEGMESTMKRLHKLLSGKKVLLVLDDLWEEDPVQLQRLKSMLTFLGDKMDVIVTTCNKAIARKICTVEPYRLNRLSDDTCWEIIKKSISFEGGEEELEKIGQEIGSKCQGVPSLARAYAGMLGSLRDDMPWKRILEWDIWFRTWIYKTTLTLTFLSFELSYMRMPPDLRLCFAYYCQIFSSGHIIVKDDLVHQWIALHLIEPSEILSAAQIAEGHITRLQDMSFLQTAEFNHANGKDNKGVILFTVHALAHDLTKRFVPSLNYHLVTNHHGKLDYRYYYDNLRALRCVSCSKVEFDEDSFSSHKLRVLELKDSPVQKLPDSICQLRYLGYLKISEFTGLVTLPESFGLLKNLFHIDLSGCSGLINLPESFGKLICLVHVDLSSCSGLVALPESFGKLINVMHINLSGCSGLVTLPESFGKLVNLVRINLSGCSGLTNLPESFGRLINVMNINLSGCSRVAALPESVGDLVNLTHVNLSRCHGLTELPKPLQKLGKLVHLDLSFWSFFEGIGKGLGGLTNLEHLNLSNPFCHLVPHRSHLKGLKDGLSKLTKLRYLNLSMCLNPIFYYHKSQEESLQFITECVKDLSTLEHLDLSHNTFLFDLPESLGDLNNLHTLNLSGCIRLKNVGEMKSLKFINLRKCRSLESCQFVVHIVDDDDEYSSSNIVQLEEVNCQELQISCLEKVKSKEEAHRTKLVEKLKLQKLKLSWTLDTIGRVEDSAFLRALVPPPNLQCLEVNGYTGTCFPEYLSELTSLQELKLVRCKQLNSLPDTMQKLTSLKDLCIFDCPELEKWCQVEENKKMLAHIPNKNYDEPASTSRPEIEEDGRLCDKVEVA